MHRHLSLSRSYLTSLPGILLGLPRICGTISMPAVRKERGAKRQLEARVLSLEVSLEFCALVGHCALAFFLSINLNL